MRRLANGAGTRTGINGGNRSLSYLVPAFYGGMHPAALRPRDAERLAGAFHAERGTRRHEEAECLQTAANVNKDVHGGGG